MERKNTRSSKQDGPSRQNSISSRPNSSPSRQDSPTQLNSERRKSRGNLQEKKSPSNAQREDPILDAFDWHPEPRASEPSSWWWCANSPVPAQELVSLRAAGSRDEIAFNSPEHKAFFHLMQVLQRIRSDDFQKLEQSLSEQKQVLRKEIEQVVMQVQTVMEKIQEASEKVDKLTDTVPKMLEQTSKDIVTQMEKSMKKRNNTMSPPVKATQEAVVAVQQPIDNQAANLPDTKRKFSIGSDADLDFEDIKEASFKKVNSSEPGLLPNETKEKKRKERRPSLGSDNGADESKNNKKLAGKRKSKKLNLDRDDYDVSLFLVSDKVEVDQLVEQAMARLNLSEEWQQRLSPSDGRLRDFIRSPMFNAIVNVAIVANVLAVAIEGEHAVSQAREGKESSVLFAMIDGVFCMFFLAEIILRLLGDRIVFFVGPDWKWNCVDLSFVIVDLVNQMFMFVLSGSDMGYVSTFRTGAKMIRLVRAARTLRMFRVVRASTRARLLLEESVASVSLGFWLCTVLMVLFTFLGLFLMQASADVLLHGDGSASLESQILKNFGSSPQAIFSLFAVISGGTPWANVFEDLFQVDAVYGFVFLFFVFFVIIMFLNVINSVFVDSAFRRSKQNQVENKSAEADKTRSLLEQAELDDLNGFVSKHQFLNFLSSPYGRDQLMSLGLESAEALGIFDLLDKGGKQRVHIGDLASGCARFTHPPRSVDSVSVLLCIGKVREQQKTFAKFVQDRFDQLEKVIHPIASRSGHEALEDIGTQIADRFALLERRISITSAPSGDFDE